MMIAEKSIKNKIRVFVTCKADYGQNIMESVEKINDMKVANSSSNMFLSLFENSINAIILGVPDGTLLEANSAALDMFGYSLDELRNLGRKSIFDHNDPGMEASLKMREREGKAKGVLIGIRKNGERFPCEFTSAIFTTENGEQRTSTILIDITERKKAEDEMALLINSTEESFVLIDKNYNIISFNQRFKHTYETLFHKGVKQGECILDFAQAERKDIIQEIYERVFNEEIVEDEIIIPLKNDQLIFSIRYKPAFDNSGAVIGAFVTSLDITEKRKAQKLVVSNEKRFRSIIEHTGDMISLTDEKGNYLYVSPSIEKLMGFTKEEIFNKSYKLVIHPDDYEESQQVLNELLKNPGKPFSRLARIKHKDGHYIWVEGVATNFLHDEGIRAIVSNYRDISEKIVINQQKEYERKNREALINSTEDLIWSVNRDFLLIAGNSAFIKTLNSYSGSSFEIGDNVLAGNFFPEDFILFWKGLYERALNGESVKQETFSPENDDTAPIWFEMNLNPIYNENEIVGVACFGRNITEKKNAQFEREQIIAELSRNNADLKQFSYVTSHNLRAPIANLLGLTSLMDSYTISDPGLKQILNGIKQAALMFDETVKDLSQVLIIKDQTNASTEQVSLEIVADKTLKQLGVSKNDEGVEINCDFTNAPFVTFTGSYLESVFMNLFTNAFKYKSHKRKLVIDVSSKSLNDSTVVTFKDNGIGIDLEKYSSKIFKLYQRFHENSDGKGLGLYLVKSQLEALGSSIEVESEVDKGTTFILKFKKEGR